MSLKWIFVLFCLFLSDKENILLTGEIADEGGDGDVNEDDDDDDELNEDNGNGFTTSNLNQC